MDEGGWCWPLKIYKMQAVTKRFVENPDFLAKQRAFVDTSGARVLHARELGRPDPFHHTS